MQKLQNIIKDTGCKKQCEYMDYSMEEIENHPMDSDVHEAWVNFSPNDEVMVEKELITYNGFSLLADMG